MKKHQTNSSGVQPNKDQKSDPEIFNKDQIIDIQYSSNQNPKTLITKKSSRSKSKVAAIISKEYKEDLVDNFEVVKTKLGHSNSFEAKRNNFNTLTTPHYPISKYCF